MNKRLLITSMMLALYSSSTFAGMTQPSGIYENLLGGWSFVSAPSAKQVGDFSTSSPQNYTWGGNLGYQYAFTEHWAAGIEAGYTSFGKTNYNRTNASANIANTGIQVMAAGSYMMSNGFNAFVKSGAVDESTKSTFNYTDNETSKNQTQWLPAAAIGIGYMPLQNFNLALQYEHTFGANWNNDATNDNKPMTQNALTLNMTYVFPLNF